MCCRRFPDVGGEAITLGFLSFFEYNVASVDSMDVTSG